MPSDLDCRPRQRQRYPRPAAPADPAAPTGWLWAQLGGAFTAGVFLSLAAVTLVGGIS